MKTALDTELFPDCCEVVHIPLHNQWIYLIQKNGSSSLRIKQKKSNLTLLTNNEIRSLDCIDVYIRNPRERYLSGVNTYLQFVLRDNPDLDFNTALWFVKRYKFLNTHYLPQFFWIANLSRYMRSDAKIRFHTFDNFSSVVDIKVDGFVDVPSLQLMQDLFDNDQGIELWLFLDQILLNLAGQEFTWEALLHYLKETYPNIIHHVLP